MEPVGPANWNDLSIGYVSNPRRGTGTNDDLLFADLIFTSQKGIDAVQSGKRAISVGYNAFYEQTAPGLGRQKDIHCNHVALVDEGRCGARCSIMDGRTVYTADLTRTSDLHNITVTTQAGEFHVKPHGEVERYRPFLHDPQLQIEKEFSRPEWLTDLPQPDIDFPSDSEADNGEVLTRPAWDADIDYADADFVEEEHPRGEGGQWTASTRSHGSRPPNKVLAEYTDPEGYKVAVHGGLKPGEETAMGTRRYGKMLLTAPGEGVSVRGGYWMNFPEKEWGLSDKQYRALSWEERAALQAHHQATAYKPLREQHAFFKAGRNRDATADADFEEGKHPRGGKGSEKGGQFVAKGTGSGGTERGQERRASHREQAGSSREAQAKTVERGGKAQEAARKPQEAQAKAQAAQPSAGGAGAAQSAPRAAASQVGELTPTKNRAYTGKQIVTKTQLSKQETGAIGEAVITNFLKQFGGIPDARPLNMKESNFPVDMIGDHELIEVKTGLVSNGASAQKWRATIGQPGKAEAAWLAKAKPEEKAAWNQKKMQAIMDRKMAVLDEYKKKYGAKVQGKTVTAIINPDTKTADLFQYDGFHLHIRWNNDEAKKAYVGSYQY
jgi:hypothetical protein